MIELRMERVKSWLACDLGQEELSSVDVGESLDFDFGADQICFGLLPESASRFASWTSDICKKIDATLGSCYPIISLSPGFTYDVFIVYHHDNAAFVEMIAEMIMESSVDGPVTKGQFIRNNNPAAQYYTCQDSTRQLVVLPYNGPQVGTDYLKKMINMSMPNKQEPVLVIVAQKKHRQTLGQCVVERRLFDRPWRDRQLDERTFGKTQFSQRNRCSKKGVTRNRGSRRNRRKTGEPTEEELLKLSTEFGTKWKQLARALEIREAEIEVVDKENRRVDKKCYHLLMVWKKQRGSLATYEALEAGLRHGAVQRKDLAEKYCLDVVTKRLHKNVNFPNKS